METINPNEGNSLFITFNENGIPERCVYSNEEAYPDKDQQWRAYLDDEIEIGFISSVSPMGRICRYDLPAGLLPQDTLRSLLSDGDKLNAFIQNNALNLIHDISRRVVMAYGMTMGNIRDLQELTSVADPDSACSEAKTCVGAALRRMNDMDQRESWNRFVQVVETDKGALLFSDSGRGYLCYHSFMQYVADNFYNSQGRSFGKIRTFMISRPDTALLNEASRTSQRFSLDFYPVFSPDKIVYRNDSIPEIAKRQEPYIRIFPVTYDAFSEFVSKSGLKTSGENERIGTLFYVERFGWTDVIAKEKNLLPELRPIINSIENLSAAGLHPGRIQNEIKTSATRILHEQYGIRVTNEPIRIKLKRSTGPKIRL